MMHQDFLLMKYIRLHVVKNKGQGYCKCPDSSSAVIVRDLDPMEAHTPLDLQSSFPSRRIRAVACADSLRDDSPERLPVRSLF